MESPQTPNAEVSRLATLTSLSILDTEEEERFDKLTRIAQKAFDVPIALVSLVDENRQWFKFCLGLDVRQTGRDISFCGHAILNEGVFIIPDALKDERFFDNPLVVNDPKIRFYAGCPLTVLNARIGTLCIIDRKPREITHEELIVLKDLASLVESELIALQYASIDELTKIPNRRGVINLIQNGINLCKRQHITSTLIFFDLNNFKIINDSFGHDEGDLVLKTFSQLMISVGRDADIFGRLGGDEFLGWLSNSRMRDSGIFIERLKIVTADFNHKLAKSYKIDFAFGIVEINPQENNIIEEILGKADKLMYENKKERN